MKRILGGIWGVWAVLVFTSQMILATPIYLLISLLQKKLQIKIAHRIGRIWAWAFFVLVLIKIRVSKSELIDSKQAYVFVSNHKSLLDIPATVLSTSNPFKYLGKAELKKIPLLGIIIQTIYILVNRADKEDRQRSIDEMSRNLTEGTSVFIFPEGTRNKSDEFLGEFYDGAFKLAIENQIPLAVMTLKNTSNLLPLNAFQIWPGYIEVVWEEPIETKGMSLDDVSRLKDMAKDKMLSHLAN